ncbi:MAG: gfo/Idh/MocA family oxidoreductase [Streptosporangiales bacterium]|nr:gfo/Idh/MocA family oxidoreductase [Streptosporangiales bacterium]
MTAPLRLVHVGLGGWGTYWAREVLPHLTAAANVTVAAAVDVDESRHAIAIEHLGLPADRCYTDVRKALAEHDADFVTVVVPPAFHEEVIDAAVATGAHILSEKPMADTMAGCVRIHRKVNAAGLKMAVTMSHRFDRDKQTLQQAVRDGRYGQLAYVVYRFTHAARHFGDWGEFRHRIPDPLLVEGSVHHLDILRAVTGADAARVYAVTWNPPWGEYAGDSTALVTLEMTDGTRAIYEGAKANASTLNGWTGDYIRAECENGTLELDRRALRLLRSDGGAPPSATDLPLLDEPHAWMNPWLAEQFCDWLRGGPAPECTVDDNLQCSALLYATIESAHTGAPVDVQDFLARHLDG